MYVGGIPPQVRLELDRLARWGPTSRGTTGAAVVDPLFGLECDCELQDGLVLSILFVYGGSVYMLGKDKASLYKGSPRLLTSFRLYPVIGSSHFREMRTARQMINCVPER